MPYRRLEWLLDTSEALSSAPDAAQVARVACERIHSFFGAGVTQIRIVSGDAESLDPGHECLSMPAPSRLVRIPMQPGIPLADAALRLRPVVVRNPDDFAAQYPAWVHEPGLPEALVCAPMVAAGRCIGTLGVGWGRPRADVEEDAKFLLLAARQCGLALERARQEASQQRLAARAALLSDATAVLLPGVEVASLDALAHVIVPRFSDACSISLREGDGWRFVAVADVDPARARELEAIQREYPAERVPEALEVLASGRTVSMPPTTDLLRSGTRHERHFQRLARLNLSSFVTAPAIVRGRLAGVVSFARYGGTPFDAEDEATAAELGRRVALALERAELEERLRAALRMREEFLTVAAHELRTPVTSLLLMLQGLATNQDDPWLAASVRVTQRLGRQVRELLDVTRLNEGTLEVLPEELDIAELARTVTRRIAEETPGMPPIEVHAPGPVIGRWDPARLDRVLVNLLSNAQKFGNGSPVAVTVTTEAGEAVLAVRDGGVGIAPEDQERIFGRFERAVQDESISGLGLGLWIVSQIARAHGGRVSVESSPGRGSTFQVRLPLAN